jgi:hypothetical protein
LQRQRRGQRQHVDDLVAGRPLDGSRVGRRLLVAEPQLAQHAISVAREPDLDAGRRHLIAGGRVLQPGGDTAPERFGAAATRRRVEVDTQHRRAPRRRGRADSGRYQCEKRGASAQGHASSCHEAWSRRQAGFRFAF